MFLRILVLLSVIVVLTLRAETGAEAWLRYPPIEGTKLREYRRVLPAVVMAASEEPAVLSARGELVRGVRGMLGRTLRVAAKPPAAEPSIVLEVQGSGVSGSFRLHTQAAAGQRQLVVTGVDARGVLYGTFALLRKIALGEAIEPLDESQTPYAPIRWVNQWDNLDGSIERGYGGRSIFWENGRAREDLRRVGDYARMLASAGIDACSINNVNANPRVLDPDFGTQIKRIAQEFRSWGVQVAIAVDFGSPRSVGGLDTFDPLDPKVAEWWKTAVDRLYAQVPDLAGFVMKADSEGRSGPSMYQRNHADAANVVARALAPHGGVLLYRGFVYDHHLDWRNPKNDRARAAVDNFAPLDGKFDENVIVQIKNGPIDFQVREPASPLFGALEKTNEALELQITQEYTGQARHMVFLVPQWKEVLDFDLRAKGTGTTVKALASGRPFQRPLGGFAGVTNVGMDDNWSGNPLSQANLYGFGRLAWNPDLGSRRIAGEWAGLTFGPDAMVVKTLTGMLLRSWRAYENYTGPLGLQTLTDITSNHFSVNVEASERNGWGQWHNADEKGVGMDRTVATGTGYAGQYRARVAAVFESVATCPDDLLLFLHHVLYTHVLHSGKTVIQSIYDSHYDGAAAAEGFAREWKMLRGRVDDQRFEQVRALLEYQASSAIVWRDAVSNYFLRLSGIPDEKGRVGHYPDRTEAEWMRLDGYAVVDVKPWEGASGGKAISCARDRCSASFEYRGQAGWRTIHVQYFDQMDGVSRYRLFVAEQLVDEWEASDQLPVRRIDGGSSKRRMLHGLALRPGDTIRIEGVSDGPERAALDYVDIAPE